MEEVEWLSSATVAESLGVQLRGEFNLALLLGGWYVAHLQLCLDCGESALEPVTHVCGVVRCSRDRLAYFALEESFL